MSTAFILLDVDLGKSAKVVEELQDIPETKYVYTVYGVYDVVIKLEAESIQHLKDIITKKIRPLEHVKSTLTMLVVE
ncbi:unnamed protein product [marine sediment metagenome]|uniref:Transcription regulator AsnC/Lrp ligand binding domain-containing protein n=1 Tax=marine sediment metagenome TaxID=412755 RepID=X1BQW1_9ZZZZ